ncbi:hypothetical protein VE26_15315 [Devosia chinhatensis]|uniref:PepSY domain-containing protein n=1 Tax=Devosia chinhatensis TaxID=429727 RepID=A0A0F5FHM2_9HYPH|nr:hypothetical protein VE26_15315 [Devosia chinhatensis]
MALAVFLGGLASVPALAALPPHYQRQAEFVAVIEAATEALGIAHPVEAVLLVETDHYEVKAGPCTLSVRIVDTARAEDPPIVGPRQFEARPESPVCR